MLKSKPLGLSITVLGTGQTYHTWKTWGLAVGSNYNTGEPEQETYYVDVPGADGFLDYSEALTGRPIFKKRSIEVTLGGDRNPREWANFISKLRVLLEGKLVHIVFDDMPGYYWEGRAHIGPLDRTHRVGSFVFSLPQADPYGYATHTNNEEWEWDPFDFEYGVIDPISFTITNSSKTVTIDGRGAPFPVFVDVTSMGSSLTMKVGGETYPLAVGVNRFHDLLITQNTNLIFTGTGTLSVTYRRRIL